MRILFAIAILGGGGCLRTTEYKCTTSTECGSSGVCELSVGFCSFPDSQCGRRFGDSAGTLANQCVNGQTLDGGLIDSPMLHDGQNPDGTTIIDGAGNSCPTGYNPISGSAHRYRALTADTWDNQRATCASTNPRIYLAIPDDATEVMQLDTLAASGTYWVGVTESGGTVLGGTQTFLPWAPGQPNTTGNSHCVEVTATGGMAGKFDLTKCGNQHPAICECEP